MAGKKPAARNPVAIVFAQDAESFARSFLISLVSCSDSWTAGLLRYVLNTTMFIRSAAPGTKATIRSPRLISLLK